MNILDEKGPDSLKKSRLKPFFKEDSKEWVQRIREVISHSNWKEDFLRGLKLLQSGGTFIADRSLSETDLFRLRRQLEQVDEKMEQAFESLGKRSMEHWESGQVLDEKEKLRAFKQIDDLKHERQNILEKIEALKASSHPLPQAETPPGPSL